MVSRSRMTVCPEEIPLSAYIWGGPYHDDQELHKLTSDGAMFDMACAGTKHESAYVRRFIKGATDNPSLCPVCRTLLTGTHDNITLEFLDIMEASVKESDELTEQQVHVLRARAYGLPLMRAPFVAATRADDVVMCVQCGLHNPAKHQISAYPDRFVPDEAWSVDAHTGAVRCGLCSSQSELTMEFYETHDVLYATVSPFGPSRHGLRAIPRDFRREWRRVSAILNFQHQSVAEEEKKTMPTPEDEPIVQQREPTLKDKAVGQAKDLGGAAWGAGQMILVNQSSEVILRLARRIAKDKPWMQSMLEDEDGREFIKLMGAFTLHSVGTYAPLPKGAPQCRKVGKLQTQTSMFILGNKYGGLIMQELAELIALGDQLPDSLDDGPGQSLPRDREAEASFAQGVAEAAKVER